MGEQRSVASARLGAGCGVWVGAALMLVAPAGVSVGARVLVAIVAGTVWIVWAILTYLDDEEAGHG